MRIVKVPKCVDAKEMLREIVLGAKEDSARDLGKESKGDKAGGHPAMPFGHPRRRRRAALVRSHVGAGRIHRRDGWRRQEGRVERRRPVAHYFVMSQGLQREGKCRLFRKKLGDWESV